MRSAQVDRYKHTVERTALYRHYDEDGVLLYVGITNSAVARINQHMKTARWANDIRRVDIEWFETRADAIDAEDAAILAEHPIFNKVGMSRAYSMPQPSAWFNAEYIEISARSVYAALDCFSPKVCSESGIRLYKKRNNLAGSVGLGIKSLLADGVIRKARTNDGYNGGYVIAKQLSQPANDNKCASKVAA